MCIVPVKYTHQLNSLSSDFAPGYLGLAVWKRWGWRRYRAVPSGDSGKSHLARYLSSSSRMSNLPSGFFTRTWNCNWTDMSSSIPKDKLQCAGLGSFLSGACMGFLQVSSDKQAFPCNFPPFSPTVSLRANQLQSQQLHFHGSDSTLLMLVH